MSNEIRLKKIVRLHKNLSKALELLAISNVQFHKLYPKGNSVDATLIQPLNGFISDLEKEIETLENQTGIDSGV